MAVEVELKAWVDDPERIRDRLLTVGTPHRRYLKEDEYFGYGETPERARYRLRRDGDAWICTFKEKRIHDGIEENRETEFTVSDGDAFRHMLESLGLRRIVRKRKEGESFWADGVLAELSHVEHVGWFVELEIVLGDDADRETISASRDRLHDLLRRLSVPLSAVESRSYNSMIYEATAESGTVSRSSV